jgi:ribulose-5-phosphate 4-epimerase/fuculose-1-phosphate aldolase
LTQRFTYPSVRAQVTEGEWRARVELAAFYRVVHRYGMTDLTNNHITLKVPDSEDHFLINPFGLSYDEITASSLVKIDSRGKMLLQPDSNFGINYTGFVIHGAVHGARPEITCVVHTHSRAGIAVSAMDCGLLMLSQTSLFMDGVVGYHDYEGLALDLDEQKRLIADLGTTNYAMILRNHGLLACGRTVAEAFINIYSLEMSCKIQVDAMASGAKIVPMSGASMKAVRTVFDKYRAMPVVGDMEWAAELRRLDKHDPTYRE